MAVKPKLALIPSGVGVDKLYSVLPSDGTGDFTFDRNLNTATRINKDGLIEMVDADVPRLNYPLIDGVVSGCPSLLLEPERRNLVQYSEDFTQGYWIKTASVNSNNSISPDGTQNADTFTDLSTQYQDVRSTPIIISANSTYTSSCFIKKTEGSLTNYAGFGVFLTGNLNRVDYYIINTTTGEINIDASSNINFSNYYVEDYGNYWRVVSNFTDNQSNTNCTLLLYPAISTNGTSINQNAQGSNVFWGAQLEAGSYPTSYIPTSGSQTTRSAETCNNSGDVNTFNDSEGVLMAEMAWINNDLDINADLSLSDNSASNRVLITQTTTKNQIEMFFRGTGATISQFFTLNDTSNFNKFAIKYKSTDFAFYINGFKLFESNSVATVSNLFDLSFDNPSGGGTRNFYGNTKQIQYFDTALNNTDLEELTSWRSFNEMAQAQLYTIL